MKKNITKLSKKITNSVLTSVLSLVAMVALSGPVRCFLLFYEPKKPEGMDDISIKSVLPKNI